MAGLQAPPSSGLQAFIASGLQVRGTAGAAVVGPVWASDDLNDVIIRLSDADLSVLLFAVSPAALPYGIGGESGVIWHCDTSVPDRIHELSTADFSSIRFAAAGNGVPAGIGGDATRIWQCDTSGVGSNLVKERSVVDFSIIQSTAPPSNHSWGMGGTASVIWLCTNLNFPHGGNDRIYELTNTLVAVRFAASPGVTPVGCGGSASRIWHADSNRNAYELSVLDFSVVQSVAHLTRSIFGIGG